MSNNAPEIRFKGFTDAWVQRKLGEVAEHFEYGLNASAKDFDGIHKYIRITDIDEDLRHFNESNLTSPDIDFANANSYLLKQGDILFARTGASVGKTYIHKDDKNAVYFAGFLIRARISDRHSSDFIYQNTLTGKYNTFIKVMSQRSGQPGVNAQEYASYTLGTPSIKEQEKLGDFFRTLDDTITLHKRKLDGLKKLKAGYLQQMFPQTGESVPRVRFAGFHSKWKERELGELFTERSERSAVGELISVTINAGVVKASSLDRKDNSSEDKSNYKKVEIGDIAYNSMRMWQGASGISNYVGILSPAYTVIVPRCEVSSLFFSYVFKLTKMIQVFQASSQGLTSDTWNLKFPLLKNILVATPCYEEQIAVGNLFRKLDDNIAVEANKIAQLQRLKAAYLQKIFI